MLRSRCLLLPVMMIGGFLSVGIAHADTPTARFGLYRSTALTWAWEPVQVTGPIASGEASHWVFVLPEAALAGWSGEARVGVVSGILGTPPRCWVSAAQPFQADPNVRSPWASSLIAGSVLHAARLTRDSGRIRLEFVFDSFPLLRSPWDLYLLIDVDGSQKTGFLGGDFLLQDVTLGKGDKPAPLSLHWLVMRPEIGTVGHEAEISVQVQNTTRERMTGVVARVGVSAGLSVAGAAAVAPMELRPLESKRVSWKLAAARPGEYRVRVNASAGQNQVEARSWISFVTARDARHEFQTANGDYLPFPRRTTLQAGNPELLKDFQPLTSGELKHNLFGITAHLPRSTNEEDPYITAHVIDGDPATCWASRWWRTAIPREPEWLDIDLGDMVSPQMVQ